jgi:hypothetical protein
MHKTRLSPSFRLYLRNGIHVMLVTNLALPSPQCNYARLDNAGAATTKVKGVSSESTA